MIALKKKANKKGGNQGNRHQGNSAIVPLISVTVTTTWKRKQPRKNLKQIHFRWSDSHDQQSLWVYSIQAKHICECLCLCVTVLQAVQQVKPLSTNQRSPKISLKRRLCSVVCRHHRKKKGKKACHNQGLHQYNQQRMKRQKGLPIIQIIIRG